MIWDALHGRKAKSDCYDPENWDAFLRAWGLMDQAMVDRLDMLGLAATEADLQGSPLENNHRANGSSGDFDSSWERW